MLFQTEDAQTRVQVRLIDGVLWLTQRQMAELYQKDVRTVNEHLKNVYDDGELDPDATIRKFRIVAREGARDVQRLVDHYNLDAVLQVGYRVRSPRGAQFRRWATETLKSYLVKGFVLDDERFKQGQDADYFDELLARIRDIRSSEKMFWRKVLDIYATSVDYDPRAEASQLFFATVQNKMHWAARSCSMRAASQRRPRGCVRGLPPAAARAAQPCRAGLRGRPAQARHAIAKACRQVIRKGDVPQTAQNPERRARMSQREVQALNGHLSLRAPQAESLARLARHAPMENGARRRRQRPVGREALSPLP